MDRGERAPGGDAAITVPVRLDSGTFRRFAFFDAFVVKRHWRAPALFSGLMFAFAALTLLLRSACRFT